ncbi:MAG: hypothetical protein LBK25_06430 [Treponema sp.]|nr:hypothetical protein [Treponema sp.]
MKYLNTPGVRVSGTTDNAEEPRLQAWFRQDGVSGTPFRTITIVKYLNTRRVLTIIGF